MGEQLVNSVHPTYMRLIKLYFDSRFRPSREVSPTEHMEFYGILLPRCCPGYGGSTSPNQPWPEEEEVFSNSIEAGRPTISDELSIGISK